MFFYVFQPLELSLNVTKHISREISVMSQEMASLRTAYTGFLHKASSFVIISGNLIFHSFHSSKNSSCFITFSPQIMYSLQTEM